MKADKLKLVITLTLLVTAMSARAQAPVRGSEAVGSVNERLARIEQLLQSGGLLDMMQQLQSIQRELNQLRGEIEIQGRNIDELRRRQRTLYSDIDQRLQGVQGNDAGSFAAGTPPADEPPLRILSPVYEDPRAAAVQAGPDEGLLDDGLQNQGLEPTPAVIASNPQPLQVEVQATQLPGNIPAAQSLPSGIDPVQAESDYQQAFELLKQSRYEDAIQSFQAFLEKYPVSDYSDNAQYWLGEAYYVMRRFEQALQEYNTLVENFPQSQKYTHALLKIGYSYHELGLIDDARKYLQSLIRNYPGTTASRLAEERLKSIALAEQ